MIPLTSYRDREVGILGLGKTGIATAQALHASGARVYLWDDNPASAERLPVGLASQMVPFAQWPWETLKAVVVSPGIPFTHPAPHPAITLARAHQVGLTSDIELLYEACPEARYVTITGTNGKSTTTSLIGHILQQSGMTVQVGGNLGTPALAMQPLGKGGIYVLELSSYQLDLLQRTRFQVAVFLNISPDHLDRHGDMEGYVNAKRHIFARQQAEDVAIIGVDDAWSEAVAREMIAAAQQRVIPIMTTQQSDKGVWVKQGVLHAPFHSQTTLDLHMIETLQGQHNHQNAAAAYAACASVGCGHEQIAQAMQSYPGLAHRMQLVALQHHVRYVNDSKATNADAAEKSLGTYEPILWIAGGVPKAGGIDSLAPYFPRIRKAYLIGEAADAFAQTLQVHVPYVMCESLQQATQLAHEDALAMQPEPVTVLLAPACASFDQFNSFEHRGDVFCETVQALLNQHVTAQGRQSDAG